MPNVVRQYLDQLTDYFANPEANRKVKELLEEEQQRTPPWFKAIQETMPFGATPVGFTKQAAIKEVLKQMEGRTGKGVTGNLRREFADLLRVIRKTPERAIKHIGEFELIPGRATVGQYHPEKLRIFPSSDPRAGSMAASFAHEAGHGVSMPMVGKTWARNVGRGFRSTNPLSYKPEELGQIQYLLEEKPLEGVAEYIGRHLQEKAGVEPLVVFGHGGGQKKVFEELSKMPSKNPYMNAYRYIQNLMR